MAVADQHHNNVQTLHSNEQIKQMTHLLVGVLHCHPASGWVARWLAIRTELLRLPETTSPQIWDSS